MAIIFLLPWLEELEKCDSCTEKCCLPIMRGSVAVSIDTVPVDVCFSNFMQQRAAAAQPSQAGDHAYPDFCLHALTFASAR